MYIANRPLSAGYKIFTALIAWVSLWFLVRDYQGSSVQFLATFVALLSGVYFLAAAFKVLFGHRHHPWRAFCPVWHGALLLGALLVLTTQVVASAFPDAAILTPTGVGGLIASLVLPLLIIFDWALFSAKGHWRLIDPWYWLCLPLVYLAINYLIIGATVSTEPLVYPYGFLDYLALGVIPTLIWIGGIMVGCLVLGFLLAGSDRAFRSRETTTSAKSTTKAAISVPTQASAETSTPAPSESSDQPASPYDPTDSDQPADSDHAAPEQQYEAAAPKEQASSEEQPAAASTKDQPVSTTDTSPAPADTADAAARPKSARTSTRKLVDVRPSTKSRRQPTSRKAAKTATSKTAPATTKTAKSAASKTTKSTTKPTSSKSPKSSKSASTRPTADTTTDTKSTRSLHGRTQVGD